MFWKKIKGFLNLFTEFGDMHKNLLLYRLITNNIYISGAAVQRTAGMTPANR